MQQYYAKKLSAERLKRCYEIASQRVKQYLKAELDFVIGKIKPSDLVLELGCGYGRVVFKLTDHAKRVIGIDSSVESLLLGHRMAANTSLCTFIAMDACALGFNSALFDLVVCIQNGICAFNVDKEKLMREALRVTRLGGTALFSTYAKDFWPHRLEWFEAQAKEGLLGEIDHEKTGDGTIVCKDGFRAGMLLPEQLQELCSRIGFEPIIREVDGSSVFCEIEIDE